MEAYLVSTIKAIKYVCMCFWTKDTNAYLHVCMYVLPTASLPT
jgi:hypothetical protein